MLGYSQTPGVPSIPSSQQSLQNINPIERRIIKARWAFRLLKIILNKATENGYATGNNCNIWRHWNTFFTGILQFNGKVEPEIAVIQIDIVKLLSLVLKIYPERMKELRDEKGNNLLDCAYSVRGTVQRIIKMFINEGFVRSGPGLP